MAIPVTGAAGLVGRAAVAALLEKATRLPGRIGG